jgi:hypothetical protein
MTAAPLPHAAHPTSRGETIPEVNQWQGGGTRAGNPRLPLQYHYLKEAPPSSARYGGELDSPAWKCLSLNGLEEPCEQARALPVVSSVPCSQQVQELCATPLSVGGGWRSGGLVA